MQRCLIEYRLVTDGQTGGHTEGHSMYRAVKIPQNSMGHFRNKRFNPCGTPALERHSRSQG